jgi:hypothetical protein
LVVDNNPDETADHIIMSDDGTGGNLFIPSMLISKSDGDIIKKYIKEPRFTRFVAM